MKRFFFVTLFLGGFFFLAHGQEFHMPQASPGITVDQSFSTSFIKLDYSRPSVRGRDIFGDLLPYGALWRTGANQATKITFGEDVSLAGHPVKAGTYALYTIPNKKEWKVMLNAGVKNWGPSGFEKKDNVVEVDLPVHQLEKPQETFLISIENITNNSCDIVLAWADVSIHIPIKTDNNERILSYLDKELKSDKPPYSQAAGYYLSTDQKLEDALKYAELAIQENPVYYLYWLKARIYQKLGKHEEAVKAAKVSAEKAKGSPFEVEYRQHYKDMLQKK